VNLLKVRSCWTGAIWSCALLVSIAISWTEATGADADAYQLVWADEFDLHGAPNADDWTYEHGFARNDELQWYQRENAFCKDGLLVIEARREKMANPEYDPKSRHWGRRRSHAEYTSASVITRGRKQWLYGRFEMRGKIDTRPGMWPAFWTLGTARPWPGCGEIDIMEYYNNTLLANACWQGPREPAWDATERPLPSFRDPEWSSKFHVWQMDWNAERIRLSVDGELLNEIDVAAAVNAGDDKSHPFREPQYLLLNLAIGGTRGGDPSQTEFPARFEIDYVRVYQKTNAAAESAAESK
jgi:beta-glucanase (GH16 family)